jgi:hypothetical protein
VSVSLVNLLLQMASLVVLLRVRPNAQSYPDATHQALGKLLRVDPKYAKPDIGFSVIESSQQRPVQLSSHAGSQYTKQ